MLAATVALLITMFAMPKTAQAADNYGFHVGNVYVTPDNCHNITGSNIKPYDENTTDNKVWYEPGTNTLYIRNTRIERTGGSNRCIRNEKNKGLTIVFIGKNYFYSKNSEAIRLESNTTLKGDKTNPRPEIFAGSYEYHGIYVEKYSNVTIEDLHIITSSAKNHAISGDYGDCLELQNVYIVGIKTGDNKAVLANFTRIILNRTEIYTSENALKTYGIRTDSKYSSAVYPSLNLDGPCSICTMYPAIHVNGQLKISNRSGGSPTLNATSINDCAIYVDWTKLLGEIKNGKLEIKIININLKGKSSGIRGNRYDKKHDLPSVYLDYVSGIIEATEPGAGLITKLKRFELTDCNIAEPYGAYFSSDKHALCDINGNIITDKVKIGKGSSTGVEAVRTDEPAAVSEIYSADGRRQSQMRCGLNIIRMTDGTTKKVIVK